MPKQKRSIGARYNGNGYAGKWRCMEKDDDGKKRVAEECIFAIGIR
jgi:hypothetical protein